MLTRKNNLSPTFGLKLNLPFQLICTHNLSNAKVWPAYPSMEISTKKQKTKKHFDSNINNMGGITLTISQFITNNISRASIDHCFSFLSEPLQYDGCLLYTSDAADE